MARLGKACPGDCSKCDMLANNEVDMIPCILDQIFQGQKRQEAFNEELKVRLELLESNNSIQPNFASILADSDEKPATEESELSLDGTIANYHPSKPKK